MAMVICILNIAPVSSKTADGIAFMTDDDRLRSGALSNAQVEQFIRDGFIRIDRAFPRELAEQGCAIMWRDIPFNPHDPATWTKPVIRLVGYGGGPFEKAANTPLLHDAFDRLVGKGRWEPRDGLGTFPVRSRIRTIPARPAGTSMRAFPLTTAIRTNSTIFPLGA